VADGATVGRRQPQQRICRSGQAAGHRQPVGGDAHVAAAQADPGQHDLRRADDLQRAAGQQHVAVDAHDTAGRDVQVAGQRHRRAQGHVGGALDAQVLQR
ncbi:hypothetical protein RZS08_04855, partial [Arthrospira platensis SPKY1]|nr:hypothetical protein [Arthrospira platensis SPKY1]